MIMANATRKPYLLTVLTGLNAGAQEQLSRGRFTIAGSGSADFLLDGLEGPSLQLAIVKGRMRVLSDRDDLRVIGLGRVVPGMAIITDLPATLQIGPDIQLHVCQQATAKKRPSIVRRVLTTVGCLAVLGAAGLTIAGPQNAVFGEAVANILAPAEPAPSEVARHTETAPQEPTVAPAPALTLDDALAMLKERVAKDGMSNLVIEASDGAIRVTGSIRKLKASAWGATRIAYERQFGQIAPLLADISETTEGAPVAISAIWLGAVPEFSTPEGDILRVGDLTATGWTIIAITPTFVALERDSDRAMVEL
jgi:hypothetical protein